MSYHFAVLPAAHAAVLQLLAVRLDLLAQLIQCLNLALVLSRHSNQILGGALLGYDLLDDFVHIGHSRGLLYLAEGVLENVHLEVEKNSKRFAIKSMETNGNG